MRHLSRLLFLLPSVVCCSAVSGACTLSTVSPSVTICTPTANSTVTSPVHIVAGTTDSKTMRYIPIYVDEVKKYEIKTKSLDTSLAMAAGTHRLTVQAYDGTYFKQTIFITVSGSGGGGGGCTASAVNPSVTICTPASNATVTSPVHIVAVTTDSKTVQFMQIYVDGVKQYQISAKSLDTSLAMAAGTRRLTVQAYDGTYFHQTVYITVSSSSGVTVAISPASATLAPQQTQQFTATVSGTTNTAVTWSVDGINGGNSTTGTISNTGLYTAPATTGSHTVTATSVADASRSASAAVTVMTAVSGGVPVLTRHFDNARTGANLNETILTPANVNSTNFGKKFSLAIDGNSYGQPLYVPNVAIPTQGTHNVIYVATENDSVYAFDADGLTMAPLWKRNFTNPAAGITTIPCAEVDGCGVAANIGITATPVIDAASGTIYVEARTKENGAYIHRVHALSLATGADKVPSVVVQASVAGTGAGSVNGQVPFDPLTLNDRPGLLLLNGVVYLTFASLGDTEPYHGWIIGYDASTLARVSFFNDTPNGSAGGYWHAAGPAADSAGNMFIIAGNGSINVSSQDYGTAMLRLSANGGLTVMDYFMPFNASTLTTNDADLGAGGPLLLPDQSGTAHPHLLISCGKEGRIYLVDRDNMGKFNSSSDQIVQEIPNAVGTGTNDRNFATPAYWNGKVYFAGNGDVLKAFSLTNGLLSAAPVSQGTFTFAFPGGAPVVSANGSANGIVWVLHHTSTQSGALHAYNANDLSTELYNSDQ